MAWKLIIWSMMITSSTMLLITILMNSPLESACSDDPGSCPYPCGSINNISPPPPPPPPADAGGGTTSSSSAATTLPWGYYPYAPPLMSPYTGSVGGGAPPPPDPIMPYFPYYYRKSPHQRDRQTGDAAFTGTSPAILSFASFFPFLLHL